MSTFDQRKFQLALDIARIRVDEELHNIVVKGLNILCGETEADENPQKKPRGNTHLSPLSKEPLNASSLHIRPKRKYVGVKELTREQRHELMMDEYKNAWTNTSE